MLQITVFGTAPPCPNCNRAQTQALQAAEQFPGQVEVVKLDAIVPEAEEYGLMVTHMVLVGNKVVRTGKVVSAQSLIPIIQAELGG